MGGQQSTRRITVINDEATGVIKVTFPTKFSVKISQISKVKTQSLSKLDNQNLNLFKSFKKVIKVLKSINTKVTEVTRSLTVSRSQLLKKTVRPNKYERISAKIRSQHKKAYLSVLRSYLQITFRVVWPIYVI